MTKSINQIVLNPKYFESLENLWNSAMDMLTYSQNTLGEIYRVSTIVRLFAKQKCKIDNLRQLCAEGSEKSDIYILKKVAYLAERMQEEKSFDQMWTRVASEYDGFIKNFTEQQANDQILIDIPTSEEILTQCMKQDEENKENQLKLALETAKAMIAL